jgi:mono/diheme cytochrome c family protein
MRVSVIGLTGAAAIAVGGQAASGETGHRSGTAKLRAHADVKLGRVLFIGICGRCHTLKAAGTKGTRGGSLDGETPGFGEVYEQILHGGDGMPAFGKTLTKAQVADIAAYVAKAAARTGGGDDD